MQVKGNDPQKGVDLSGVRAYCRRANQEKRLYEPHNQRALQDVKEISAFLSIAEFGNPQARRGAIRVLQEAGFVITDRDREGWRKYIQEKNKNADKQKQFSKHGITQGELF
jgi:uncharacterized phage-like protein YoqJ